MGSCRTEEYFQRMRSARRWARSSLRRRWVSRSCRRLASFASFTYLQYAGQKCRRFMLQGPIWSHSTSWSRLGPSPMASERHDSMSLSRRRNSSRMCTHSMITDASQKDGTTTNGTKIKASTRRIGKFERGTTANGAVDRHVDINPETRHVSMAPQGATYAEDVPADGEIRRTMPRGNKGDNKLTTQILRTPARNNMRPEQVNTRNLPTEADR